jgi:ribosomal protein S12 methylthiotransferase accessory factor
MLDIATLLDPSTGLVSGTHMLPPSGDGTPFWRATVNLACEHAGTPAEAAALALCTAGACATSRSSAVIRAAGEAVERMALHGPGSLIATASALGDRAMPFWAPEHSLAAEPGGRAMGWYPATRLIDGGEWFVPAGLVEYPGADGTAEGFDPGPSGAASGLGAGAALRGALLETVERDAVIVAWARQLRLTAVDVDAALAAADRDPQWTEVERSVACVRAAGLAPVFARIPLGLDGLVCVVGGVMGAGTHHRLLSLGAKVAHHPAAALYGALHESLQLYSALRIFESPDEHRATVSDETERVRFLASASGLAALEEWLSDPVAEDYPTTPSGPDPSTDDLLAALVADGLDPYVVDLTDRLPERVRALGWSVAKVLPVGYQPLRIDERTTFGWNRARLASVEHRTGATARLPMADLSPLPHPLP